MQLCCGFLTNSTAADCIECLNVEKIPVEVLVEINSSRCSEKRKFETSFADTESKIEMLFLDIYRNYIKIILAVTDIYI